VTTAERVIGAVIGAAVALIFLLPESWADLVRRGTVSIVCGVIFAVPLREWLEWTKTAENMLASACAAAFLSWFVMTAIVKGLQKADIIKRK
jgi:hypothetical protein